MLLLHKEGYGLEQGIPTLLMAACSVDDIIAITCFTTCLGIAFATGIPKDTNTNEKIQIQTIFLKKFY